MSVSDTRQLLSLLRARSLPTIQNKKGARCLVRGEGRGWVSELRWGYFSPVIALCGNSPGGTATAAEVRHIIIYLPTSPRPKCQTRLMKIWHIVQRTRRTRAFLRPDFKFAVYSPGWWCDVVKYVELKLLCICDVCDFSACSLVCHQNYGGPQELWLQKHLRCRNWSLILVVLMGTAKVLTGGQMDRRQRMWSHLILLPNHCSIPLPTASDS